MNKLNILIADDHQLFLDGLKALLQANPELQVIAQAENGEELIAKTRLLNPQLVITDIDMPVLSGMEAVKMLRQEFPSLKIIVLTMHKDAAMFSRMKNAGADGYLHKNCDNIELNFAIQHVMKGKEYVSSEIQDSKFNIKIPEVQGNIELTKREVEIITLIAEGLTNNEIGEKLFISPRTVNAHRTNLMKKINVNNVAGIIRFAFNNHIVM